MVRQYDDYLLRNVSPAEFEALKREEADIVSAVIDGFNEVWRPRVQGITTTFRYNTSRDIVGIFLEREGQQLIVEGEGLSEAEKHVVGSLYTALENRLDRLRLPKERWVDSVSEARE
ncbi:MAG: hypothetical protein ABIE94_06275 [archaeon]